MTQSPFQTLAALEALDRSAPTARKLLVAPDVNWGRDLLVTLARNSGGWIGWEVVTLRGIAGELAFVELDREERRIASDVEITALVDRALDDAVAADTLSRGFAGLAQGLGFRAAVRDSLLEARTAGVAPARLRTAAAPGSAAADLATVLAGYESLLDERRVADPALVFARALASFDREAPFVLGGTLVLAPDLRSAGLPGRLLARLVAGGATTLAADPVFGVPVPERMGTPHGAPAACSLLAWLGDPGGAAGCDADAVQVDLFAAATPGMEVREALRRALADGCRWEDVELVTTDPDSYGVALDAVCRAVGLEYSALHGLPLARTRIGRALARWLDWLGNGLPADALREALEAGDLGAPEGQAEPPALARMLRSLEIGWGRARYAAAVERLRDPSFPASIRRRDDDDDTEHADRVAARRRTATALAALLERVIGLTPEVPERGSDRPVSLPLAALAAATTSYLELVPLHGAVGDAQTLERLCNRLGALAESDAAPVRFSMAMAQLRDAVSDVRAWPAAGDDRKPWSPAGGRVHLTDPAHAGLAGRPRTFVLGLDADRTAGPAIQDPILTDAVRRAIQSDGLPSTAVRRAERAWTVARGLARLRGRVTLSYAVAGESGDRATGPAHLLLQALRLQRADISATYDDLRTDLGAPACAVPGPRVHPLDGRDVWLGALGAGPLLLDGDAAVREAWPGLARALAARTLRTGPELTPHHGIVVAAAGRLDPRNGGRVVSSTSLELLGRCPLAWFYKYGLNVRPPADPEYDPEAWLDPMARGSLLHSLYERVGRAYHGRRDELAADAAFAHVRQVAEELLAEYRATVPPPSEAVYQTEADEIRAAALAFLAAERDALGDGADWREFELDLGDPAPTRVQLQDGAELRVIGKVDRVDALRDGSLHVIDYKTGKASAYVAERGDAPFKGGRRLQVAIYAAAVEARGLGRVSRFEYRFPTPRGENRAVTYTRSEIDAAASLLPSLLGHLARGEFVSTDTASDCSYCDYQAPCRAERGTHSTASPRAEWAAEHAERHGAYAPMIARRTPEPA